jgi:hypothetical protein
VLYDVLAVGIPRIDAAGEMGAIYRHRALPQSSSASRLTASQAEFLINHNSVTVLNSVVSGVTILPDFHFVI